MNKSEFITKIAEQMEVRPGAAEIAVNATLAELVAPRVFTPDQTVGFFDNNCNNNCKEELARINPTRLT